MKSWDRTQIPRPFSAVAIAIGDPVYVTGTDEAVIEAARVALETTLRRLEDRARAMLSEG